MVNVVLHSFLFIEKMANFESGFGYRNNGLQLRDIAISSVVTDRACGTTVGAIPTRDVFNYRILLV